MTRPASHGINLWVRTSFSNSSGQGCQTAPHTERTLVWSHLVATQNEPLRVLLLSESLERCRPGDSTWLLPGRGRPRDWHSGHTDTLSCTAPTSEVLAVLGLSHQQNCTGVPKMTVQREQNTYHAYTCQWAKQRSWPVTRTAQCPGPACSPNPPLGSERNKDSCERAF